jgi:hypothetical protein
MFTEADVEAALREHDGSCRDINFTGASWNGLHDLVQAMAADFGRVSVGSTSHDTHDAVITDVAVALDLARSAGGMAQILLNEGRGFVTHLQIFVFAAPGDSSPDIELTFFPQDIRSTSGLATAFLAWADRAQALTRASGYYARYENASWTSGDVSPGSGVFFVRTRE